MVYTSIYYFQLWRGSIWNLLLHHTLSMLRGMRSIWVSYPVIPYFYAKIEYLSHVCAGSFIPHTRI
jgi:hypothetical protein